MILDRSKNFLDIFVQPFIVDQDLPKHKNKENKKTSTTYYNFNAVSDSSLGFFDDSETKKKRGGLFSRLFKKKPEMSVLEFFQSVKLSTEESKATYIERTQPYLVAIKQAQKLGQTALVDKLKEELELNKYESILVASGYGKKIEESQMVKFAKKSEKGIKLVYIKNFTRPIPEDVATKKLALDKLEVFDNYCILFYDTTGDMSDKTAIEKEEERQKKADPILFGMINGVRALYYVADWTDEYCDLTLSEFLKIAVIGEGEIEIPEKIKIEGI